MIVQLFTPCFIDQLASDVGVSTYNLLLKLGCRVIYPEGQTCCGQAAYNAGYASEAKAVTKHFYTNFSKSLPIVVPSASCVAYLHQHKPREMDFFPCYELTYFINHILGSDVSEKFVKPYPHKVAYHYSCSSLREYPVTKDALSLLRAIKGIELIEEYDSYDECCGFGGSFSLKFSAISESMAKRKIENILRSSATRITSADMSCLLHLDKFIKDENIPLKVVHISEILDAACA